MSSPETAATFIGMPWRLAASSTALACATDDTIVVLVSDNGASGEAGPHGSVSEFRFAQGRDEDVDLKRNRAMAAEIAAGYAACFGGALEFVASQHKKNVAGSMVTCSTAVGPREGGGFGIAVKMHVKVPGLATEEARALVQETHDKICPYSHATRGNIDFALEVEGA